MRNHQEILEIIKKNMELLRDNVSLNKTMFCSTLNISPSFYSDVLYNRANPSLQMIIGAFQAYPTLNINWLFYNQGEMFLSPAAVSHIKEPASQYKTFSEWEALHTRIDAMPPEKRQAIFKKLTGLLDLF